MKQIVRSNANFSKFLVFTIFGIGLSIFIFWHLASVDTLRPTQTLNKILHFTTTGEANDFFKVPSPSALSNAIDDLKVPQEHEIDARCWGTTGTWCKQWFTQKRIPTIPPPRGTKPCLWDCNHNVGVCDAIAGRCRCPAGWTGDACNQRMRRPCSQIPRKGGFLPHDAPINWTIKERMDSRCSGECDEDIGMCFCPSSSKYGRKPANNRDPPGTPPLQIGRPLGDHCQPNKTPGTGTPTKFGDIDPEKLFGPRGWCEADNPEFTCPCYLEGMMGMYCNITTEHFCLNQCSGHGECSFGWCKCHEGYFGQDCAFRLPGVKWNAGLAEDPARPWLADHIRTPAAEDPLPGSTRKRPLIYIYELPPLYNQLLLQYRNGRNACAHRLFYEHDNSSEFRDDWNYQTETGIHEMLLQSTHRTLNPEEADFFYIPVYAACWFWPLTGAADFPHFHGGPAYGTRPSQAVNMLIEAWSWLRSHYPYWDRKGGKDHILVSI